MSTLNTIGIGRDHERLGIVAYALEQDGHGALAAAYQERADTEAEIWRSATDLGQQLIHLAKRDGAGAADRGADLAAWLVRHGWTPPAHFNGRITE